MFQGGIRHMLSLTAAKQSVRACFSSIRVQPVSIGVPKSPHVPNADGVLLSPTGEEVDWLSSIIEQSKSLLVLTGAGISTASGIPDYRGPNGSYNRGHKPMTHGEFMNSEASRKRFWARSMVGWQTVSDASPNNAHYALARLEAVGQCDGVITQNVDRLHHKAGSENIIDLHGRVDQVRCQCCKNVVSRRDWQHAMTSANVEFMERMRLLQLQQKLQLESGLAKDTSVRADGDAELNLDDYSMINVPECQSCGGVLKLDVVMFGDNVPTDVVARAYEQVEKCDSLLVVGTSLEVFSAYRFVHRANLRNAKIAIINYGQTRAEREKLASIGFKSEANCAELLHLAADRILLGK